MFKKLISGFGALTLGALCAWADLPLELVNSSAGAYADSDIYVAIIGKTKERDIYYDLGATSRNKSAVLKPLTPSVNNLHHDAGDWGYADIFTRLSDIQDNTIYIGDTFACRLFISFKSPMYLHAFDAGYAGADMNNPGDPNADIRWELIEFTNSPNEPGQPIWINTTRVDAFQYPMGLELYSASPAYIKRGEKLSYGDIIKSWNNAYGNTVYKDCYSNPIRKDNLGGIIKQPSKVQSVKASNLFGDYINRVWDYFRYNTANISMGVLGRWEGRVYGDQFVLTCKEGTYWAVGSQGHVNKPTTEDAIEGAGPFAAGSDIDKTVQAMFCAAFNRGQFRLTTAHQDWNPETGVRAFTGGSEYPCNEYVKFFHDTNITVSNGYTYAFAYDDTFDQSATCHASAPYRAVVTIGGFVNRGDDSGNTGNPSAMPAAPAPSRNAADVKSFFSGAYGSVVPGMFVGDWGQATASSVVKCGNDDAYKFDNFNYFGFQFPGDALVDASDMQYLHVDLYAPEAMDVNIVPISLFPTYDKDGAKRHLEGGKWNSFDIALSEFPNVNFSKLGQFKFDGGNGKTFYLDNLYMWKESARGGMPAAPAPRQAAGDVKSFYSGSYASVVPGMFVGSWGQSTVASKENCGGNEAYKFENFNYLGFQFPGDAVVDVTDMQFLHIDLYAPEAMDVNIVPISLYPTYDRSGVSVHLEGGRWNSFDIALSVFPNVNFSKLGQFKFDGGNGKTFYLDNLYMWKEPGSAISETTYRYGAGDCQQGVFYAPYTVKFTHDKNARTLVVKAQFTEESKYVGWASPMLWHYGGNPFERVMAGSFADGYTVTFTNVNPGEKYEVAVKAIFANLDGRGGMGVTPVMSYTVPGSPMRIGMAGVDDIEAAEVAEVSVWTISGMPVSDANVEDGLAPGVYVRRTVYTNGKVKAEKFIVR